ncbi:two-component regulator propeller domain-containing protein [Roseivirga sp.]|uniref:type IX secretion system anionic LPS delivery protein PorZ n=1 Tax=Roseivirga sp. TaxID=1964215 RepID=UPI003B8ACCCB
MKDSKRRKTKRTSSVAVLTVLLLCISTALAFAQSTVPILGWRTHFSYNNITNVTDGGDRVFASTENAIFYVDLEDNSLNLINKNTGLSDVGIGAIFYDQSRELLVIAYKNGRIEFWSETAGVTTINTVLESEIVGSKHLRNIELFQNKLYISGDLGIIVYDQTRNEIVENYRNLGPNGEPLIIYETAFTNDSIFAVSENGILSASLNEDVNKQDFNNWRRILEGISFQHITQFGDELKASADSDLFDYTAGEWSFERNYNLSIKEVHSITEEIFYVLTEQDLWVSGDISGFRSLYSAASNQTLNSFLFTQLGSWIGSSDVGLLYFNAFNVAPSSLLPAGPSSDLLIKPQEFGNSAHWISASGSISSFNLETQEWSSRITRNSDGDRIDNLTDLEFGITETPNISLPIFSSFGEGPFFGGDNLNGSTNIIEDFSNSSPITRLNGSYNNTALAMQENLLWLTTSGTSNTLYSWNLATDQWNSYGFSFAQARFPTDLFIGSNGFKWMPISETNGGGLVVFDETTSRQRFLNTNGGQGGLPGAEVTSLAIDDDQFIWIGTNQGLCFFPNQSVILDNISLTANVPIFENRLLLRDEFITQVLIDPANRKWFGTRNNGLWLFSETGEELVYHFTTENSPLPSNNIISLFVDRPSGELFIGTDKGLISFRSDATEGSAIHENVKIYPNPVNRSFQGEIVINGLANNAIVKITDVSGKLVREARANGSTLLWNTRNINGVRVASGVYLVFSSSSDGVETFVGKIVVI